MNLEDYDFKEVTELDLAFGCKLDNELLKEAENRGFLYGDTEYNSLFAKLFFKGGTVVFKKDAKKSFVQKAWPYCRAVMASFAPKHEHKEAVCAMLMSEMLEPELKKQ